MLGNVVSDRGEFGELAGSAHVRTPQKQNEMSPRSQGFHKAVRWNAESEGV